VTPEEIWAPPVSLFECHPSKNKREVTHGEAQGQVLEVWQAQEMPKAGKEVT